MKYTIFYFLFSILSFTASAQADTTIYAVAEEMPRFPFIGCEQLDTTLQAKYQCSQQALIAFVYSNIQYPIQARLDGIEGMVVTSFVVEPDSTISNLELLKDIGGGCGATVMGLLGAFNEAGVRWIPGKKEGEAVRTRMTVPVKFRLTEAPPYIFMDGDTVYTEIDALPSFKGGDEVLNTYIEENLSYPEAYKDTCLIGYMDVRLLVQPNGVVKTLEVTDYCNLGLDYQLEILNLTTSMFGKWEPSTYEGRPVPASVDLRLLFSPPNATACQSMIDNFNKANATINAGVTLYNEGEIEAGFEKMDQAIELFPNNGELLMTRGQIMVDENRYQEACEDLTKAKAIMGNNNLDQLLLIICNTKEAEEE